MAQAETLLDALEKKQPIISMDTPQQLPGSDPVRPDLWNRIAALKKDKNFSCAQRPIAEAEVNLVWAGHENSESGPERSGNPICALPKTAYTRHRWRSPTA